MSRRSHPPPSAPPGPGPFAALLREARERAGLSQRELAERASLSRATVADAELGGDPRLSTLQALCGALPLLGPERALSDQPWVMPGDAPWAWHYLRERSVVQAHRVTASARVESSRLVELRVDVEGIRPARGGIEDRDDLARVLRAVFGGRPEALQDLLVLPLDASETRFELEEGDVEHAFVLPRGLGSGLRYTSIDRSRRRLAEGEALVSHATSYPVRTLVLRAALDEAPTGVTASCRLATLMDGHDVAGASWDAATREASATVALPLPFVAHELKIAQPARARGAAPEPARDAARDAARDPARALARARAQAGLGCRGLATAVSVSPATVHGIERGLDARRSTWLSLLGALPGLRPRDLIAGAGSAHGATRAEVSEHYRRLVGVEVATEMKVLGVSDDGAIATCRTRGLRRLVPRDEPLVLRHGAGAGIGCAPADELREIGDHADGGESLRTRLVRRADGTLLHQVAFAATAATRGVSYETRAASSKLLPLRAADARRDALTGTALTASLPARRLVIEVELHRLAPAASFRAHAWMPLLAPEDAPDLGEREPEGTTLAVDDARTRARLTVTDPLIGFTYAISWKPG